MAKNTVTTEVKETLPDNLLDFDYGDDAGSGMEDVDRDEQRVPFLRTLQSNSPQVDESKGGTLVEGAKGGMLILMSTNEIWKGDGSVEFVTAFRDKDYVEWVPYDAGGGLVGRRGWDDPLVADLRAKQGRFGKLETADGTEIAQTFYLYGLLLPPDGVPRRVVMAFTSTQIKKYQAVIDRMSSAGSVKDGKRMQPPIYAWKWKIKTGPEKNKKGSFFGVRLELAGATVMESLLRRDDPLYLAAKEFNELLKAGEVTADIDQLGDAARDTEDLGDARPLDDVIA